MLRVRFFIWLSLIIVILFSFFRILYLGFNLNTNVLDLLPKAHSNNYVQKSSNVFSNRIGRELVFLIGNKKRSLAEKASLFFFKKLDNNAKLFNSIDYIVNKKEERAWGTFYFPYRLSLLNIKQRKLLKQNKIKEITQDAILSLYSPMGVANSELLKSDPFFLFQDFILSLPKPANNITLYHNKKIVHYGRFWYVMINARLKSNSFSLLNQNKVIRIINHAKKSTLEKFKHSTLLMTGMLFYAKHGADEAQRDISRIGIGSIIGIVLLVLLTFRSIVPLFLVFLSAISGFLAAFVATYYIFSSFYILTIVFGASIIGISVDYAFFYYSDRLLGGDNWSASKGLKNILSGITLALVNIVLAYAVLFFTPFPGIKQLALFAIVGLVFSYLTVVLAFPYFLKCRKHKDKEPCLLKCTNFYLELWKHISIKKIVFLYLFIFVFSLIGIYKLKPNDNIHILESVPIRLKHKEVKIKKIIGSNLGMNFYIVTGKNRSKLLENEKNVTRLIDRLSKNGKKNYIAISSYLPTILNQKENFRLIKKKLIASTLEKYLENIGISKSESIKIRNKLSDIKFKKLTIQKWLNSPVSKSLKFLWLGKVDGKFVSVVLLSNNISSKQLYKISNKLPFVFYINKSSQISKIFKVYRKNISILLLVAFLLLFLILSIRYSIKKSIIYFLSPFSSIIITLGLLGWFHIYFTLFNLFGLILILGISLDYMIFFVETKSSYNSTMLATSLSAIATILSFGLLSISKTPVVHYFGITVLIGIISAVLLSPVISSAAYIEDKS